MPQTAVKSKDPMICVICEKDIKPDPDGWAGGHNPEPVKVGRCCGFCNNNIVIPARFIIAGLIRKPKKENIN